VGVGAAIDLPFGGGKVSFVGFLFIAPLILIAITLYLHVFVDRWLHYSYSGLEPEKRLPTIFNFDQRVARWLSGFLFYWLVPIVLLRLTVKALPQPEASQLVILTCLVTGVLVWLQIQRCPDRKRRYQNPVLWGFLIALIYVSLITLLGKTPFSRPLMLFKASLNNMDLRGFKMPRAFMAEATLTGANLQGANLDQANLFRADLFGADLSRADLRGTDLLIANLSKANLSKANLSGANLRGADLSGADLSEADLNQANLSKADLFGANLRGADLFGANLSGGDLSGADLIGASNITPAQIKSARNWRQALYTENLLKELGLPPDHNRKIQSKPIPSKKNRETPDTVRY
jgi:uncharacterized protein YjbI with pentapeptide repeats